MPSKLKVLFATAELTPLAKVGGLADVAGALPPALGKLAIDIRIIIPKYGIIDEKKYHLKKILTGLEINFNSRPYLVDLYQTKLPNSQVLVYLIDNKHFLGHGGVYLSADASSLGTTSEFERFGFFTLAIIETIKKLGWQPQIIHGNDWHVGLLPKLVKINKLKIKTLTTIHNLAYQGWYKQETVSNALSLEKKYFQPLKNCVVTLREAILDSDLLNTVSPSYAKEILTPAFGCGLENDLQKRSGDLSGILNGIDIKLFNPQTDKLIVANYNARTLKKKLINKKYLQKISGLAGGEKIPLLGIIGRLTEQKGFDLILPILDKLMELNLQLVILATGDKNYEKKLRDFAQKYPAKLSFQPRFDLKLAQQIYAGADFFLMPSRFEPCGLGQMIAMRYGAAPIVRATGGLRDTVVNLQTPNPKSQTPRQFLREATGQANSKFKIQNSKATGFSFIKYDSQYLYQAIQKAINIYSYQSKIWQKLQQNGMHQNFSWNNSAKKYLNLYRKLLTFHF